MRDGSTNDRWNSATDTFRLSVDRIAAWRRGHRGTSNLAHRRIRNRRNEELPDGVALIARTLVLLLATMFLFWAISDPKTGEIRSPMMAGAAFLVVVAAVLFMAHADARHKDKRGPR
jgi:hypothetical protein